ncbi:hypothetical protein DFJ73DRAFT_831408 [Zopfochytrium polystomum]|nr:hypothetical protein DFJ73DRAFT_831408 [Zopfochytrium polystomum]
MLMLLLFKWLRGGQCRSSCCSRRGPRRRRRRWRQRRRRHGRRGLLWWLWGRDDGDDGDGDRNSKAVGVTLGGAAEPAASSRVCCVWLV